jgi:hypothetical protein
MGLLTKSNKVICTCRGNAKDQLQTGCRVFGINFFQKFYLLFN